MHLYPLQTHCSQLPFQLFQSAGIGGTAGPVKKLNLHGVSLPSQPGLPANHPRM